MSTLTAPHIIVDADVFLGQRAVVDPFVLESAVKMGHRVTLLTGEKFIDDGTGFRDYVHQREATLLDVTRAVEARAAEYGLTRGTHFTDVDLIVGPDWPSVENMKRRMIEDNERGS